MKITSQISSHLDDNRRGERLRSGLKMTIYGKPNVGKSTLMNLLAEREVAIVSTIAGTTRDTIETHLDIGGYPIVLTDTAGIRENTDDIIEKEGIKRAYKAIEESDIKIKLFDVEDVAKGKIEDKKNTDSDTILVVNKTDLLDPKVLLPDNIIMISAKENIGVEKLLQAVTEKAQGLAGITSSPAITRERHRAAMQKALKALNQCNLKEDLVLAAEDIRIAIRQLSILIGKIEVEEILGEIFSNFCIGK